jgi:ABC-type branched-subunit amino acid transport system ATPase component
LTAGIERAALLEVRGLRKDYGGVRAVDDTSFTVPAGGITGLIGPNGAGKSTVLGMIAGAIRPTAGSVVFDGSHIEGKPPYQLARQGLVRTFQIAGVFDRLTVLENLLVGRPMRGESLRGALLGKRYWREEQAAAVGRGRDLLRRFELAEKQDEYAGNLSGGQKRLLEIARALMARPRLLLLDEPSLGLAPLVVRQIGKVLQAINGDGVALLLVDQSTALALEVTKYGYLLETGHVVHQKPTADLLADPAVRASYLGTAAGDEAVQSRIEESVSP